MDNQELKPRRSYRRLVFFLIGLLLLTLVTLSALGAYRIVPALSTIKTASTNAQTALKAGDFVAADAALTDGGTAITRAQSGVTLLFWLRPLPWVGTQLNGLTLTLDAGAKTIAVLHEAVGIATEISKVTTDAEQLVGLTDNSTPYSDLPSSAKVAMLTALHNAYPELLTMQLKLKIAQDDLSRLADLHVSSLMTDAVKPFADALTPLQQAVDLLTPFSAAVPELAGLGADKQFLLLFANDTELRPGGGFMGVFGLAITRDGAITNLTAADSYSVDNLVAGTAYHANPPAAMTKYLGMSNWYFRDANWSPDFSQSAQDSIQLLRQEVGAAGLPVPEVHGAMMFTPTFVGRLINLIGPVTVDNQTFTQENIADKIEYQVEQGYVALGLPPAQRKEIVSQLMNVVVERLLSLPTSQWPALLSVLDQGFAEKEVALWSPKADVQAVYHDAGWSGTVAPKATDDTLMVVDANLGAMKSDPVVERHISYSITPSTAAASGYDATTSIQYTNHGTYTWKTTRYRTYTRVYAPLGSTLITASGNVVNDRSSTPGQPGDVVVADELGLTSFGAFITINPGETQTLSFTYHLPSAITSAVAAGVYQLDVIKQLGALDNALTLNLNFGHNISYAVPAEAATNFGDQLYTVDTTLDTNKSFTVRLDQ